MDRQWLREQLVQCEQQILPHWNPHLKLDFIKTMLRSKALELRAMRKRRDDCASMLEEVNKLSLDLPLSKETANRIDALKLRIHEIEEIEAEALRIKAGVKWREEGEKSTAYFLAQFKAKVAGSTMQSIQLGRRVVTGTTSIISVVKQYYENLYNKPRPEKIDDDNFCANFFGNCPSLDREQREAMARPMSVAELEATLKTCSDSAPGLDGIPYSFYVVYSDILLKYLLESWEFAIRTGELADSHKRSCISLLPKKGKDLSLLGNWRPISLSACDLKVITKAYANRLKTILPSILSVAQAAYTPGRDINFNNRLLNLAKLYATKQEEDFCIVSLDAQKAFDSVDHSYLIKVLETYGFPPEFITVFETLYSNLESVVQVNGHLSAAFKVKNGVKQGDALSCGLFVLAMDPLLRNMQNNDHIEGLNITGSGNELYEIKVLAYADDVTIVCRNASLQPIFDEYEKLSKVSGLVLNAAKTEVFNLIDSQYAHSRIRYLGKESTLLRVEAIRICGIWLSKDGDVQYSLNIEERIKGMEATVSRWGRRNLSINGRMILAKTFLLSVIVFPAQVFMIRKKEIKKIERLIYAFVNGAKNLYGPERIARALLKAPKEKGGINGVDVESFVQSMAVKQFIKASEKHPMLGALQVSTGDDVSIIARKVLKANYCKFALDYNMPDIAQLELISGMPVQLLLSSGTKASKLAKQIAVESLWEVQQALLVTQRHRSKVTAILRALPRSLANLARAGNFLQMPPRTVWFHLNEITRAEHVTSKMIREHLLSEKFPQLGVRLEKVYKRADWPPPGRNYESSFKSIWSIRHPALRAIRLKVLYKDVFCNERRHRFGISDSPMCEICGHVETVEHQLFLCSNATRIWQLFYDIAGIRIDSLFDVLECGSRQSAEILKSVLIKALLQIDRSKDCCERDLICMSLFYLGIERRANSRIAADIDSMIALLQGKL